MKLNKNKIVRFVMKILLILFFILLINGLIFVLIASLRNVPKSIDNLLKQPDLDNVTRLEIINKYNLNKSAFEKLIYFWNNIFTGKYNLFSSTNGSFGVYTNNDNNVFNYFVIESKYSYLISIVALISSVFIGYYLGYKSAISNSKVLDYFANFLVIFFISLSLLVLIPMLANIWSSFGWLIDFEKDNLKTYILPIISLFLISMASILQITRSAVLKVKKTNYYKFGITLGLSKSKIFWTIIFPISFYSLLSLLPFLVLSLFTSSVFLEAYFNIPGNWHYLYVLIVENEYQVIAFLLFFMSLIYSLVYVFCEIIKFLILPVQKGETYE